MTDNTHSTNARQAHVNHACQPAGTWTITLNKYQRDNLLLLLNVCGYPSGNQHAIPGMDFQTGDWMGEIAIALAKEVRQPNGARFVTSIIDQADAPNGLPAHLRHAATPAPASSAASAHMNTAPLQESGPCHTCEGLGTIPHMAFKRTKYGTSVLVAQPLDCPDCNGTGGDSIGVVHAQHGHFEDGDALCSACGGNGYTPQLGFKRTKFGSNVLSATPIICVECHGVGHVATARDHQMSGHLTPLPAPATVVLEDDDSSPSHTVCPACSTVIETHDA